MRSAHVYAWWLGIALASFVTLVFASLGVFAPALYLFAVSSGGLALFGAYHAGYAACQDDIHEEAEQERARDLARAQALWAIPPTKPCSCTKGMPCLQSCKFCRPPSGGQPVSCPRGGI